MIPVSALDRAVRAIGSGGLAGLSGAAPSGYVYYPSLGQASGDMVRYSITEVSDDPDEQVEQVIGLMRGYANADAQSSAVAADAANARATGEPLQDTWDYLRRDGSRGMRFVRDEVTSQPTEQQIGIDHWKPVVEMLMRPCDQATSSAPQGDCDDFAMLGAAHLIANGVPVSFCTVAADAQDPRVYSHVYLVAYPKSGPYAGRRVPMDLSHGPYLGWEVENRFGKRKEWPLDGGCEKWIMWALVAFGGYLGWKYARKRGWFN